MAIIVRGQHLAYNEIMATAQPDTSLNGRVEALENDIKDIYIMQTGRKNVALNDKKFTSLPLEEKILIFNTELLKVAKQAGVSLPRS